MRWPKWAEKYYARKPVADGDTLIAGIRLKKAKANVGVRARARAKPKPKPKAVLRAARQSTARSIAVEGNGKRTASFKCAAR